MGGELANQEAVEPGASNLDQGKENQAEKAMAPNSSTLAWKILWTEEASGL